jgi:hypothetical protein
MAAIDAVSLTLKAVLDPALDVLLPALPNEPFAEISDLQGNVPLNPSRLTLFLFDVQEDVSARNRPRIRVNDAGDVKVRKPDMALRLQYLATPWSANRLTEQAILTLTMQTLYDGAILHGAQLKGDLANSDVALKVTLLQLSLEDVTRIWNSVQKPFRVSVIYQVRVVPVESLTEAGLPPVTRRSLKYAPAEAQP